MGKIIVVHSFRGGTGKTNVVANTATCIASKGKRVGMVDTDIQSPGIHVLFGFEPENIKKSLNDYLWRKCSVDEAVYDVTKPFSCVEDSGGKMYLLASSMNLGEITKVLKEGYEVSILNDGLQEMMRKLKLDYLFIDTHPGINEETLLSIAISDASIVILRPDNQDYQGTKITVEVCKQLSVPNLLLVMNKVLPKYDFQKIKQDIERIYDCPIAAILPQSDDIVEVASRKIFYVINKEHPFSQGIEEIANRIMVIR